jgi:hypothetical protein
LNPRNCASTLQSVTVKITPLAATYSCVLRTLASQPGVAAAAAAAKAAEAERGFASPKTAGRRGVEGGCLRGGAKRHVLWPKRVAHRVSHTYCARWRSAKRDADAGCRNRHRPRAWQDCASQVCFGLHAPCSPRAAVAANASDDASPRMGRPGPSTTRRVRRGHRRCGPGHAAGIGKATRTL